MEDFGHDVKRAANFYWTLKQRALSLVGAFALGMIALTLPVLYATKQGWSGGLPFFVVSLLAVLLFYAFKPVRIGSKLLISDSEYASVVEEHMERIYRGSKSWLVSLAAPIYVLTVMVALPAGNPSAQVPDDSWYIIWIAGYGAATYGLAYTPNLIKAMSLERISKSFGVSRKSLKKYINYQSRLAPRTLSMGIAVVIVALCGILSSLAGFFIIISYFVPIIPTPAWPILGYIVVGGTMIVFGLLGPMAAIGLNRMLKMSGLNSLAYCGVLFVFSLAINQPEWVSLFPQPLYINYAWLWAPMAVIIVLVWRNWRKMVWRREDMADDVWEVVRLLTGKDKRPTEFID